MVSARGVLAWALAPAVVLAASCKPDLNETVSIVTAPRVLAVSADPAEAAPKGKVTYTALVVDQDGVVANARVDWAFCNARKPLAQLGPVNPSCLQTQGDFFVPIGVGPTVGGALPDVACRQFGPEVPEAKAGQPAGRPVDPDPTGGYYQPVRLFTPSDRANAVAVTETRLACGVAGATPEQATDFSRRYRVNVNPKVDALTVADGAPLATDDGGATNPLAVGQKLTLEVSWAICPIVDVCGDSICGPDETLASCPADCTKPHGCTGAERYVALDLASKVIVERREGIHVSWFATGGSFDLDRTGRDVGDAIATSDDGWKAPSRAGPVHLWVVLHDDRGGVGWAGYAFDVQ